MSVLSLDQLPQINFSVESNSAIYEAYINDLTQYTQLFSNSERTSHGSIAARHLFNKLVEKWLPNLGFSAERIQQDVRDLQTPKNNFISSLSFREAVKAYKPGGNWLIPNLLRKVGMYVLIGEPKAGKSLLMYHLMFSMGISQEFLGKPVQHGKVLFLQLEEPLETISERMFYTGFGDMADDETSLVLNFGDIGRIERTFDITQDIPWLINVILEYQPALVIIDSLRKATMNSNTSENSNEFGKLVYALQQVFIFTGTCGIVIHHMNKSGSNNRDTSLIHKLSGHGSIGAGSDGLIGISCQETDDGRLMTLKTLPRNGSALTIDYTMSQTEGGLWTLEKVFEDTPASTPITGRILRFLGSFPGQYFSAKAISIKVDVHVLDRKFKDSIEYLKSSQILATKYDRYTKTFKYSLSTESAWIINPTNISEEFKTPVLIDANSIMKRETKRELRDYLKEVGKERWVAAEQVLFQEEKDRVKALVRSWEFEPGDIVMYNNQVYTINSQVGNDPRIVGNKYTLVDYPDSVLEQDMLPLTVPDKEELIEEEVIPEELYATESSIEHETSSIDNQELELKLTEDTITDVSDENDFDLEGLDTFIDFF